MHPRQLDVLHAGAPRRTVAHGCLGSSGQLLPSLPAPRLHDIPPGAGGHTVTESMALRPTADIWLVRSFHVESFWPSRGPDHFRGRPPDSALLFETRDCSGQAARSNGLRAAPFGSGECISGDSVSCSRRHEWLSLVTGPTGASRSHVHKVLMGTKSPRWPRRRPQRRGANPECVQATPAPSRRTRPR